MAQNEQLLERIAEQEAAISALQAQILLLQEQLSNHAPTEVIQEKISLPAESVKIEGKEYKFQIPLFSLPGSGEQIKASEAITDQALLLEILSIEGQQILRELV